MNKRIRKKQRKMALKRLGRFLTLGHLRGFYGSYQRHRDVSDAYAEWLADALRLMFGPPELLEPEKPSGARPPPR